MSEDRDRLGRDLHAALDRVIRRANLPRVQQRVHAAAGVSLDRSSYWLATWLSDAESLRLSDLATLLHVDLSTVSRQVQAAERAGVVARSTDPADGRASRVVLTAYGRQAVERVRAVQRAEILLAIADWPSEEQQQFADLLGRFATRFVAWAVAPER